MCACTLKNSVTLSFEKLMDAEFEIKQAILNPELIFFLIKLTLLWVYGAMTPEAPIL